MGASRTLLRKLDLDLMARIEASGRPEKSQRSAKRKTPREADTYRGRRRNGLRGSVWPGIYAHSVHSMAKLLNRSSNWMPAKSYEHAREISPSAEPVR